MAAVVCELQAGDVLVVATEHGQQFTCGHLDQSKDRNHTPELTGQKRRCSDQAETLDHLPHFREMEKLTDLPQINGLGNSGSQEQSIRRGV